MSKKTTTQSKPAPQTTQPPAKTTQSAGKSNIKEAPKTVAKGAFDPSPFVKSGTPEEVVLEIKNAFDLFDTDQGGSIDTKGIFLSLSQNLKPLWSLSVLILRMVQFSK